MKLAALYLEEIELQSYPRNSIDWRMYIVRNGFGEYVVYGTRRETDLDPASSKYPEVTLTFTKKKALLTYLMQSLDMNSQMNATVYALQRPIDRQTFSGVQATSKTELFGYDRMAITKEQLKQYLYILKHTTVMNIIRYKP